MKQHFLEVMGVTRWEPRRGLPGAKPEAVFAIYQMQRENSATAGYLFVGKYFDTAVTFTEIHSLLTALFKATGLIFTLAKQEALQWPPHSYAVILGYSLEEQVNNLIAPDVRKIVTEDPIAMIRNPACKRKVWQDLQAIIVKKK